MSENDNIVFISDYFKSKRNKAASINQNSNSDPIMEDYFNFLSGLYKREFEDHIEYYNASQELEAVNYIDHKTRRIYASFDYYKGKLISISKYFYNDTGFVSAIDFFSYKDSGALFQREHFVTVIDEIKPCFIERFRDGKPSRFIYYADDHENIREVIEFSDDGGLKTIETRAPNYRRTDFFDKNNTMISSEIEHLPSGLIDHINYFQNPQNPTI